MAKKKIESEKIKNLAEELEESMSEKSEENEEDKENKEADYDKEIEEEIKKKAEKEAKKETLIPLEDYIKCAVHLGTKVITPHMRKFVYKKRADGIAVIDTISIDKKLKEAINFLGGYEAKNIYLICKREAGWPTVEKFGEATGIQIFTKKYSPGITTNIILENFFEAELTIICDPWLDKNALNDTFSLKKPVIGLCDTNNYTAKITKIIPCNNKSRKSIGCILYILAREYCKAKGMPFNYSIEDFAGKLDEKN